MTGATVTVIRIEIPDNLADRDKRLGAIITAAIHARAKISVSQIHRPTEDAPEGDDPDPRGPRLVPRRDPHLCWRIHPGAAAACQLPDGHDLETP